MPDVEAKAPHTPASVPEAKEIEESMLTCFQRRQLCSPHKTPEGSRDFTSGSSYYESYQYYYVQG
jgi:hypothetical protein